MANKVVLSCQFMTPPVFLYESEDITLKNLGFIPPKSSGPIDVSRLPISGSLREEITLWDQQYQNTFNSSYPPDSGFASSDQKVAHTRRGAELAE